MFRQNQMIALVGWALLANACGSSPKNSLPLDPDEGTIRAEAEIVVINPITENQEELVQPETVVDEPELVVDEPELVVDEPELVVEPDYWIEEFALDEYNQNFFCAIDKCNSSDDRYSIAYPSLRKDESGRIFVRPNDEIQLKLEYKTLTDKPDFHVGGTFVTRLTESSDFAKCFFSGFNPMSPEKDERPLWSLTFKTIRKSFDIGRTWFARDNYRKSCRVGDTSLVEGTLSLQSFNGLQDGMSGSEPGQVVEIDFSFNVIEQSLENDLDLAVNINKQGELQNIVVSNLSPYNLLPIQTLFAISCQPDKQVHRFYIWNRQKKRDLVAGDHIKLQAFGIGESVSFNSSDIFALEDAKLLREINNSCENAPIHLDGIRISEERDTYLLEEGMLIRALDQVILPRPVTAKY